MKINIDFLEIVGHKFFVNFNKVVIDLGLKWKDFELSEYENREHLTVYSIKYLPDSRFEFEIWWRDSNKDMVFYQFNENCRKNYSSGNVRNDNRPGIINQLKGWMENFKNEINEEEYFKRLLNPNDYNLEDGIISDDNNFSQAEFDKLNEAIVNLDKTVFTMTGLTLEAIQDLKLMVDEIKHNMENSNFTKKDVEESIIGKLFKNAKAHAGDQLYCHAVKKIGAELLSVFKQNGNRELSSVIQILIG